MVSFSSTTVTVYVDRPWNQHAQSQATIPPQEATASAAGSSSKEPKSGFDDVVMPQEWTGAATAASDKTSDADSQDGIPGNARQDAAEPEATLPGGTATEGGNAGSGKSHSIPLDAKQRRLDWSAATGNKRKAAGDLRATCAKPLPKRQCKLKLSSNRA